MEIHPPGSGSTAARRLKSDPFSVNPSTPETDGRTRRPRFAILALGFRPFFLLAGISAVALMVPWVLAYSGFGLPGNYYGPYEWHPHEMIFGYTMAVVAGFLLTAVRNWTGRATPAGWPLALLVLIWLAGRVVPFLAPWIPSWGIALVDCLFIPALAWAIGQPLLAAGQHRNLFVLAVLMVLLCANLLVHLAHAGVVRVSLGQANVLALETVVVLMVIMGGRVIPAFTSGVLGGETRRLRWIEFTAVPLAVLLAGVDFLWPGSMAGGIVAAVAAVVHFARLGLWYRPGVYRVPLLWVLHLGYGWIVFGFLLRSLAALDAVPPMLAWHAFATGGIGVLTLGMMARVSLGHTGRTLRVGRVMTTAFLLVNLAAFARVVVPMLFQEAPRIPVAGSGVLWAAGFLLFTVVYWPILTRPRIDGRPR